jgi:hypothetical protein
MGFFGFLGKTGVFFKAGLFRSEGLAGWRGGLRRPLPGLEGKRLPAPALDGGECRQGGGMMVLVGSVMIRHYYGSDCGVRAEVLFSKSIATLGA